MKALLAFLLVLCSLAASHGQSLSRPRPRPHRRPPPRPRPRPPRSLPHPVQAWNCSEGPQLYGARQIDAGMGKVVVSDNYRRTYFLSAFAWHRLGRMGMKHVSVGAGGLWGCSHDNKVYKYVAGEFKLANDSSSGLSMYQVDAGGDGQIVGVGHRNNNTYCLKEKASLGRGALRWTFLSRTMMYYSCGPMWGCWGIDKSFKIWVTKNISPTTCGTSGWAVVPGPRMRMIEVSSDGKVFGVSTTGKIYQRTGISNDHTQGTGWVNVPMHIPVRHVSYDLCNLWIVTTSGLVMKCSH